MRTRPLIAREGSDEMWQLIWIATDTDVYPRIQPAITAQYYCYLRGLCARTPFTGGLRLSRRLLRSILLRNNGAPKVVAPPRNSVRTITGLRAANPRQKSGTRHSSASQGFLSIRTGYVALIACPYVFGKPEGSVYIRASRNYIYSAQRE